jgi:hypothetical protein
MIRAITLPAINKTVSLGAYVKAIKTAKAHPDVEFKHGLTCWWPCKGSQIMLQFRQGLMERINQARPYIDRGCDQESLI